MKSRKRLSVITAALLAVFLFQLLSVMLPPLFLPNPRQIPAPALPRQAGERVCSIDDNQDALLWRLRLIQSAQQELLFTTFDLKDDDSGRDLMAALYDAADRGVEVKMVLDGFHAFLNLRHNPRFQTLAAHPNVQAKFYNPVHLLEPWKYNYRMHDKMIVADGERYLLGGRNSRNVSLGNYQEKGDVDRDILVVSPEKSGSVREVQDYFQSLWELPASKRRPGRFRRKEADGLLERFRALHTVYPQAFTPTDWTAQTVPAAVSLLHNPIQVGNKVPVLWQQTVALMEKGSEVIVQTPYLICNGQMKEDLTRLCADAPVTVILNAPECGANIFGTADYQSQRPRLQQAGLSLHERLGPRSSHRKTVLVDHRLSLVGSFNFDVRSAHLDTETMLLIDSPELNRQLRREALQELDCSRSFGPDGAALPDPDCQVPRLSAGKRLLQGLLKFVVLPFRHLL